MSNHLTTQIVTDEDVEYFRQRLHRALGTPFEPKARKQLDQIQDSLIIYHEQRPSENE